MLDSVEESFKEDIVLFLVGVLQLVRCLECLHQLAELLLVDLVVLGGKLPQISNQRVVKPFLRACIFFVLDGSLQQVLHKLSHRFDRDVIVSPKVEEQRSENLLRKDRVSGGIERRSLTSLLVIPLCRRGL